MTVRRATLVAAVVVLVTATAGFLLILARAGLGTPSPVAAVADPSPTPVVADASPTAVVADPSPTHSLPTFTSLPPPAPSRVVPAPFVQRFAAEPTATPLPPRQSPTAPLTVSAFVDGCDHNYGTPTQCVPLTFPAGVTGTGGKCAWLAAHGFTGLIVAGRDAQDLDADGDGIACE
ncbi:hypothetical protein BJY16_008726 [Actinoplanes octamycinicus]|uniref:Excalibur calcium-binding domain-containing protein n=1 Tax=Actinoplanes octamycinicus TaxID=135948 RepID=A0A7W7H7Y5_9ACTN|nr:hypothetical protein [Actinoplanes octamycinicus]MBB4745267.1 hypothetical protein [Actinoplanes octamycinicus]GIE62255.1 hypothetical protein Aoc01nite_76570 [Actinoplanes octamycinicus]